METGSAESRCPVVRGIDERRFTGRQCFSFSTASFISGTALNRSATKP